MLVAGFFAYFVVRVVPRAGKAELTRMATAPMSTGATSRARGDSVPFAEMAAAVDL
jgi:hypothetical protein